MYHYCGKEEIAVHDLDLSTVFFSFSEKNFSPYWLLHLILFTLFFTNLIAIHLIWFYSILSQDTSGLMVNDYKEDEPEVH